MLLTFGRKTRHSVMEVQNIMKSPIMVKEALSWSCMTNETAAPAVHMITTL
jgi:hypothetical protein